MKNKSNFIFGATPTVRMRRSAFDLSHTNKTSMSLGRLYPVDVTEVYPGDTFKFDTTQVCRLTSAFLRPVMDNVYMDLYYFFVPNRLVYDDWESVMGENKQTAWAPTVMAEVPSVTGVVSSHSVADYLGLPLGQLPSDGVNVLPFRGFALIYDQWFRNENVINPMNVQKGEIVASETLNADAWSPANYTGQLPFVGKQKDYFTSCLPSPQKGSPISIPLLGDAPLKAGATYDGFTPMFSGYPSASGYKGFLPVIAKESFSPNVSPRMLKYLDVSKLSADPAISQSDFEGELKLNNAYADLSQVTATNVSDLRFAFQLQKMLEKDARYGTRYREYLLGHFGVSNPDARMQVPEFLGGRRMPINIQEVRQTNTQLEQAEGAIQSPLGSLGASSHSVGHSRFAKSFTEHGFVFTVACIRQIHTYQQGINRMWFRKERNDYYDPLFANLSEQPVYQTEIYSEGATELKGQPFGYNEAWADLRYKPSVVTGEMRSKVANTLDVWHFADEYTSAPVLSPSFIEETATFFDRTVAVPSQSQDNFIIDFYFNVKAYRVMPTYSVPGLIDHH